LLSLLAISLPVAFLACTSEDEPAPVAPDRLNVVTTIAPITSITENIGGTRINLQGVVPEGTDSHTFEPPPSIVATIEEAHLIVMNGLRLEEPTLELAEANKRDDAVILLVGDATISADEYEYDFSFPQPEGKPNPHLWPDPTLAKEYATLIRDQLVRLDETNADYYNANYSEFKNRLELLDQQIQTAVQTVPRQNRKLLTYHDSWAYWAETYGMTVIGAIQPSDFSEPSASEVAGLIDQVRDEEVPAIFGSEVFPSDVLQTIANETGADYVDNLRDDDLPNKPGDELHSYIGLMVRNMQIMIPALGGDAAPMDIVQSGLVFTDGPSGAKYPQ